MAIFNSKLLVYQRVYGRYLNQSAPEMAIEWMYGMKSQLDHSKRGWFVMNRGWDHFIPSKPWKFPFLLHKKHPLKACYPIRSHWYTWIIYIYHYIYIIIYTSYLIPWYPRIVGYIPILFPWYSHKTIYPPVN